MSQVWVPQSPQGCVAPGVQTPPALQLPHLHELLHAWDLQEPMAPQLCTAPGGQTPWSAHFPQAPQLSHVCVPQSPHDCLVPGLHTAAVAQEQAPQSHLSVHACAPKSLHGLVSPEAQVPSLHDEPERSGPEPSPPASCVFRSWSPPSFDRATSERVASWGSPPSTPTPAL